MELPNTYRSQLEIQPEEKFLATIRKEEAENIFMKFFTEKTENKAVKNGAFIEVKNSNPLFFFHYTARLQIEISNKIVVFYSFSLIELFKLLILLVIFAAFFSKYTVHQYLVVISLFSLFFVLLNLLLINSNLRNLIKQALQEVVKGKHSDFSLEQQQWLNDKNKCPACGFEITIYDKNCPDCDLKLRNKVPPKPYDISGDYQSIKYNLKK